MQFSAIKSTYLVLEPIASCAEWLPCPHTKKMFFNGVFLGSERKKGETNYKKLQKRAVIHNISYSTRLYFFISIIMVAVDTISRVKGGALPDHTVLMMSWKRV
jgi:hypothetical protein